MQDLLFIFSITRRTQFNIELAVNGIGKEIINLKVFLVVTEYNTMEP